MNACYLIVTLLSVSLIKSSLFLSIYLWKENNNDIYRDGNLLHFNFQVEVYDKDTFGSDDSLGTVDISLSDLVQGIEKPMWVSFVAIFSETFSLCL